VCTHEVDVSQLDHDEVLQLWLTMSLTLFVWETRVAYRILCNSSVQIEGAPLHSALQLCFLLVE